MFTDLQVAHAWIGLQAGPRDHQIRQAQAIHKESGWRRLEGGLDAAREDIEARKSGDDAIAQPAAEHLGQRHAPLLPQHVETGKLQCGEDLRQNRNQHRRARPAVIDAVRIHHDEDRLLHAVRLEATAFY